MGRIDLELGVPNDTPVTFAILRRILFMIGRMEGKKDRINIADKVCQRFSSTVTMVDIQNSSSRRGFFFLCRSTVGARFFGKFDLVVQIYTLALQLFA